MKKKIVTMLTVIALMITMTAPLSVFAGAYDNDNETKLDLGLRVLIDGAGRYDNTWVGDYTIGTAKSFSTSVWVGNTNYENVRRELKISGTGTVSHFEFNNDGKWVPVSEYNSQVIPKALSENAKHREFHVTFDTAGRYIIQFSLYDSDNKLLRSTKYDIDVTDEGIAEHVDGNFPETVTESPETTTKAQPSTNPETTTQSIKVPATSIKSATKKKTAKKAKISLKKVKSATGYQIQISTSKKFKKVLVTKNVKKYKATVKSAKIKNKKKLYVRARAYKTVNKKNYYGSWTKAKKITIK